ncbi:type-F conjugative transfer system pilin assembly protein TrbC [uncultured Sphingomonas sp.]|uniref:type-F conjugative transfer system pilin assembly protein TrbC n=1 Tax=uncultured Sphingomonas sp. TaxID=158754 RepID=UPI00263884E5|nr:type-F conjugative transfer system pilin assembly protein TrbC [uncultured Sphingomonas sp.]
MPICGSSNHKLRGAIAFALLAASAPGLRAQETGGQPSNARDRIEREGGAALDRLKAATAARKSEAGASRPSPLPEPSPEMHRRAFDGLRRHAAAPAMDARARQAVEKGQEAIAAEREAMAHRLGQAFGLEAPDMRAVAGIAAAPAAKGWVPVLFVSSSMPVSTLRTYAGQLERVNGVLAFRGVPGGLTRIGPMAKLSAEMLRLDPGCEGPACAMRNVHVIVDPLIFRQHAVTRVPALAMVPGDPTQPYCEREDESPRAAHVVYGDAALSGLLEEYARIGGGKEVRDAEARLQRR